MRASARMRTPQSPRRRRSQQGWGAAHRAIASLGPARALRAALGVPRRRPSVAMARIVSPLPSVRAEKHRAAGACVCRRTHALRALTCRSMFERSAQRAVSSAAAPADRASQVARSAAEGHARQGRLSFGYFSLAKQRKVPRPPGETRPRKATAKPKPASSPSQATAEEAPKNIAASASKSSATSTENHKPCSPSKTSTSTTAAPTSSAT